MTTSPPVWNAWIRAGTWHKVVTADTEAGAWDALLGYLEHHGGRHSGALVLPSPRTPWDPPARSHTPASAASGGVRPC